MSYQESTLNNGLRVATEFLPNMETVSVAVSVGTGARYEEEKQGGISHLLEHMAFKGTDTRSARDIAEQFDMIGGALNAYTSLEHTVYYAKVLKQDAEFATRLLADILINSTFVPEELERERGVILQEIAMHHDTPDDLVYDIFHGVAWPGQPLGQSILGTESHIKSHNRQDLVDYMNAHYHAPNMVLSAAGCIDHNCFVNWAEEAFSKLHPTKAPAAPKATYQGGERRVEKELEQLHMMLGFPAITFHDPDYYVAQITASILGGGMSSRLFQEIREKRGLVYHISAFTSSFEDTGILGIYAATGEEHAAELLPALADEIRKLCDHITPEELRRAKNQHKASLLMSRESTANVSEWIGRHLLNYGKYYTAADIAARIDAVTEADVARMAQKIFLRTPISMAALGPHAGLGDQELLRRRLG